MSLTYLPYELPSYELHFRGAYASAAAVMAGAPADAVEWNSGALIGLREGLQGQAGPRPPFQFVQHAAGAVGLTETVGIYRGLAALQTDVTGVATQQYSAGGAGALPLVDASGLDAGYTNPSWRRVAWLSCAMAMDAGTLDRSTGLLLIPFGAPQTGTVWPSAAAANRGGFGVVGDGAGGWRWGSYGLGASPANIIEEVALPVADPEDWTLFELIIVGAAPGRAAELELRVNGATVLTRDWTTAPALIGYASTDFAFHPSWFVGTASGDRLIRGPWEWRNGRYHPDGGVVQS